MALQLKNNQRTRLFVEIFHESGVREHQKSNSRSNNKCCRPLEDWTQLIVGRRFEVTRVF